MSFVLENELMVRETGLLGMRVPQGTISMRREAVRDMRREALWGIRLSMDQ